MASASSEDRALIRESARAFLADNSPSAAVRKSMETEHGYDPALWERVAGELAWQGVAIDEAHGGLGLGWGELAILMEEMGASLFCSPFLATICLAGAVIREGGSDAQKSQWLPTIASGTLTAALAYAEPGTNDIRTEARTDGDSFVLHGTKRYVVDGQSAGLLIVAARKPGSTGQSGVGLFALPPDTKGVGRKALPTLDQTRRQAEVTLNGVRVSRDALIGEMGGGWQILSRALDLGAVALAAEQAGGARRCLELTVDYVKERVQFGRPIGSFQAIKHRCADMMVQVESAANAARYAADAADAGDAEFPLLASMAKAYCSDAFYACAADTIQLHGGVGFTWEYDPHLYFKRARASASLLGDANYHRERIAAGIL
ncbi:MAG TPA: acyl-CoA dehydrogenase family protein [Alphaproteobacteria bacterium]|nr:acyl-CoA dehydrogenase family protein [Alphaproteobacteria bacterium]